jgi:hypothetical protein
MKTSKDKAIEVVKELGFEVWFEIYCRELRDRVLYELIKEKKIKLKGKKIIWLNQARDKK